MNRQFSLKSESIRNDNFQFFKSLSVIYRDQFFLKIGKNILLQIYHKDDRILRNI